MIKPSIGRKLWFWPAREHYESFQSQQGETFQPEDATVVYVFNDRCVNLRVTNRVGESRGETSVVLIQDGDELPAGRFATWMPFQVGQALLQGKTQAMAATS